ncbi:MAG: acyl-CoA dehydratase activase [Desulfosarcinaceae bacterium]
MTDRLTAGVDIGSRTAKALVLEGGRILATCLVDTGARPTGAGRRALEEALARCGSKQTDLDAIVATGYGRVSLTEADRIVTELSCHARGVHFLDASIAMVIDIGGQDSKAIHLDPAGALLDFVMNDRCAAGTGRFLESAARVLETDIDTLGSLSAKATRACRINSTCAVFAESEIISLIAAGEKLPVIGAGLCRAFAGRIGNLARRIGIRPPVAVVGGGAKNPGMRRALAAELEIGFAPLAVDPQLVGALGAAVMAAEGPAREAA